MGLPDTQPPSALLDRLRGFDSIVSWYGSNRDEFRSQVRRLELPFEFFPASPAGQAVPRIHCPPNDRQDFIVIHPFSSSPRKNWPLDRYQELARRVGMPVKWCAGPEEQLENAVRIANLYDLACWLATAQIYLGNDSGITHLAAAVGIPIVAVFGPTDPAIWAPRGEQVRIISGNLAQIQVDQVLKAVNDLRAS